jgi:hypothetical protein
MADGDYYHVFIYPDGTAEAVLRSGLGRVEPTQKIAGVECYAARLTGIQDFTPSAGPTSKLVPQAVSRSTGPAACTESRLYSDGKLELTFDRDMKENASLVAFMDVTSGGTETRVWERAADDYSISFAGPVATITPNSFGGFSAGDTVTVAMQGGYLLGTAGGNAVWTGNRVMIDEAAPA